MGAKLPAALPTSAITAVFDTRELDARPSADFPFTVERQALPTGDVTVRGMERLLAVETKWSLSDLLSCVGRERKRFDAEMQRLIGYPHRMLLVASSWGEVELGQYRGNLQPKQIIGSLCGWMSQGIPVVMAGNVQRAEQILARFLWVSANRRWKESRQLVGGVLEAENKK